MAALVGHHGHYTVSGRCGVTVMTQGGTMRYRDGQQVVLEASRLPLA